MSMNVTTFKWFDTRMNINREGYYMDEFLAINLMGIPKYLDKSYDCVGIVSGHGHVRVGKSTVAQQIAYFLAWLVAGGKMAKDELSNRWFIKQDAQKEVHFNLKENIVFSPEDLMKSAGELYEKYGKNQVIIYDEGRAGLDSASAMATINKAMQNFFQECGMYGHIIIIVLPNYFKLHEDYAVTRSLFLVDTYVNKKLQRGYFNFYNETQKEWLYFLGKKKIGISLKYTDSHPSFSGRFTAFLPIDKEAYEQAKRDALKNKSVKTPERTWKKQRDAALFICQKVAGLSDEELAKEMATICGHAFTRHMVSHGVNSITQKRAPRGEKH